MSCEDNKAVVRQFVEEFWNKGRMAAADELMTPDATIVLPGRGRVNKEAFKMFARALRDGFLTGIPPLRNWSLKMTRSASDGHWARDA